MKTLPVLLSIFSLLMIACKKEITTTSQLPLNQSVELKKGLAVSNSAEGLQISLDSVVNDSRCPTDVVCVWEGNAEAYFTCSLEKHESVDFTLNSNPSFLNDTLIYGYRIKLLDIKPYPLSTVIIDPDDYTAEISITKE